MLSPTAAHVFQDKEKPMWLSPLSEHLLLSEATEDQSVFLNKTIGAGGPYVWSGMADILSEDQRLRLLSALKHLPSDSKLLVLVPRRSTDTLDCIYATVLLRRFDALMAGAGAAPRKSVGFVVHAVHVEPKLRRKGYATQMIRKILGQLKSEDPQLNESQELRNWLGVGQEAAFEGGYFASSNASHMWDQYCEGTPGYTLVYSIPNKSNKASECRYLEAEGANDLLSYYNETVEKDWMGKYGLEQDLHVMYLINTNRYMRKLESRRWSAKDNNLPCPKYWAVELGQRGTPEWAFMAVLHRIENKTMSIAGYHSPTRETTEKLLHAICCSDDMRCYAPTQILMAPVNQTQIDELPGADLFECIDISLTSMVYISGYDRSQKIRWEGQRQHVPDPSIL